MKKIGLLGGSFDPVHLSHIELARNALDSLLLDEVQLIPIGIPCQKEKLYASSFERVNMLHLSISNIHDSKIKLNDIEIKKNILSYTIDTINEISKGNSYTLIMGSDQINNFDTWYKWDEIVDKVNIAVALRENYPISLSRNLLKKLNEKKKYISLIPLQLSKISSSYIRKCIKESIPVEKFLDYRVLQYIIDKNIYHK